MESSKWVEYVRAFHKEKLLTKLPDKPTLMTAEEMLVENYSLDSELLELKKAYSEKNLVEIIDACADGIYIFIGIALKCGVDISPVFEEVQRSNMDKLPAGPGTFGRKTADGKSMKHENWIPPRIAEIIDEQAR